MKRKKIVHGWGTILAAGMIVILALVIIVGAKIDGLYKKIDDLEIKSAAEKLKAEAMEKDLATCRADLGNKTAEWIDAVLEAGVARKNLKKLETSTKSLMVPAKGIIDLCDAVGNMCMIDKAKLLEHINSLRVHVAPGE